MKRRLLLRAAACGLGLLLGPRLLTGTALAQPPLKAPAPRTPGPRDKCPVCGMFVHKYPEWVAQIIWKDDSVTFFDGAKDFFKFLNDMARYAPGRTRDQIAVMYVSEYYKAAPIDAAKAFYVIGSDVLGPMGHELVPLVSKAEAEEFMRDHKGRRIVTFDEVGPAVLKTLE